MKACITLLKRRRSGSIARTESMVDADGIRLGRATDCDLFLDDVRVALHAARITASNGVLTVEATSEAPLIVNGQAARVATLHIGDSFSVGPFDFECVAPAAGIDLALDYELARPLDEGEGALKARSTFRLADAGLSRRKLAWTAFLLVFVILFAIPFLQISTSQKIAQDQDAASAMMPKPDDPKSTADNFHLGTLWTSGEISDAHKFLSTKCETCHQDAFAGVGNKVCLSCHTGVENHADPLLFVTSSPQARGCTSCHKEHLGADGITPKSQALCVDCHGDMKAVEPTSTLPNVRDFGTDHPDFRPTILVDAQTGAQAKLIIADDGTMQEESTLKFSHEQHLRHDMYYPGTTTALECSSCHVPEFGGQTFRPIKMKGTCDSCHKLSFDANRPDRGLPHGNVEQARAALREFYQSVALEGTYKEVEDGSYGAGRRAAGETAPKTKVSNTNPTTLKWARAKAHEAEKLVFGDRVCGTCHIVNNAGTEDAPEWLVVPVKLNTDFLPKAHFDHAKHQSMDCASCHKAESSTKSTDLLIPQIATCRTCHAGGDATSKVPSTCTKCHDYHIDGMQPMAGHNGMMMPFSTMPVGGDDGAAE